MPDIVLRCLAFGGGIFLVISTVLAAIRSFVLPRNETVLLNTAVFRGLRLLFNAVAHLGNTYQRRDRVMALYAPVGLVALPIVWLGLLSAGYTSLFWALGEGHWERCFRISNSSLLTLGSEEPSHNVWANVVSYSEATLGLLLMTLLISYLPTIYQGFFAARNYGGPPGAAGRGQSLGRRTAALAQPYWLPARRPKPVAGLGAVVRGN